MSRRWKQNLKTPILHFNSRKHQSSMTLRHIFLLFWVFMFDSFLSAAQEIDNTAPYKYINADGYVRLYTDNDYFNQTDDQYTEGLSFEIIFPVFKDFLLWKLLAHPKYNTITCGIGVEQAAFTPTNLVSDTIERGDRPFAATLYLRTFQISTDTIHKQRFTTTLCTGVIGEVAQGGQLQDAVHAFLNYVQPPGWEYQIHNDVILNYQVSYQKQFLAYGNDLSIDAAGMARAGTLSDKQSAGIDIIAGYFESPFNNNNSPSSKFHIYFYESPEIDLVEYDETLQGGLFEHTSPYTIPAADINRVTFMNRMGIDIVYKSIHFEYCENYLSRQFTTGTTHLWGGVEVAIKIK